MAKNDESLSPADIEKLISVVLGPEEDWSEAADEYVLRLYGLDPSNSSKDACDLILRLMDNAREKGEEVPAGFMNILWDLTSKDDWEADSIASARRGIEEMQQIPFPPHLAAAMVTQHFRDKGDLSEDDEQILRDLAAELLNEVEGSNNE